MALENSDSSLRSVLEAADVAIMALHLHALRVLDLDRLDAAALSHGVGLALAGTAPGATLLDVRWQNIRHELGALLPHGERPGTMLSRALPTPTAPRTLG